MQEKLEIGGVEILAFIDMYPPPRPTTMFFPDVPPEDWEPYKATQLNEHGEIEFPYCLFALRSQGQLVLADTGIGPGPHPTRGNRTGDLMNQLGLKGISPEDVDVVVHTHMHFDHVGWNVTYENGKPTPTFPRARYIAPQKDWDYYTQPQVLAESEHVRDQVVALREMGLLDLVDGEHSVTPEISTIPTPGHTPGHQCILITSQGARGIIVGDVFHMSVQVQEPGWSVGVDLDKPSGVQSREKIMDMSEQHDTIIAAGHFGADEHFGRIVRLQGRRYWQGL